MTTDKNISHNQEWLRNAHTGLKGRSLMTINHITEHGKTNNTMIRTILTSRKLRLFQLSKTRGLAHKIMIELTLLRFLG